MPEWLIITIISAGITGLATVLFTVWGKYFKRVFVKLFFTVEDDINRRSEEEYRSIMADTVSALKERVLLLEKWKSEAITLENRVEELENILTILRNQKSTSEFEMKIIRGELDTAKVELKKKETSILSLQTKLDEAYLIIKEGTAKAADNSLKISALLHEAGAEEDVIQGNGH